jgi:glycosyltransferase involved in cell wall biosynthesis
VADGIIFHGAVPHSQLISQLKSLDVLLHPSLEESFGVTVAEGMALGLPVVAGENSGAVPWVVGADTPMAGAAILVDVLKADAMAAALVRVFDETYEARSLAGIRRANEGFTSKAVAGAYLDRYYQIVGESAATRSAMARLRLSGTQV